MDTTLILTGVILSTIVKLMQNQFELDSAKTSGLVIILALGFGLAYHLLNWYGLWDSFFQVYVTAGATYAFIIKNIEKI